MLQDAQKLPTCNSQKQCITSHMKRASRVKDPGCKYTRGSLPEWETGSETRNGAWGLTLKSGYLTMLVLSVMKSSSWCRQSERLSSIRSNPTSRKLSWLSTRLAPSPTRGLRSGKPYSKTEHSDLVVKGADWQHGRTVEVLLQELLQRRHNINIRSNWSNSGRQTDNLISSDIFQKVINNWNYG